MSLNFSKNKMFLFLENVIFSCIHTIPKEKFPCFDSTTNIQEVNLVSVFITKFIKGNVLMTSAKKKSSQKLRHLKGNAAKSICALRFV